MAKVTFLAMPNSLTRREMTRPPPRTRNVVALPSWSRCTVAVEAADDIVLLLDGLVQIEANGTELARLGPGSILGERASGEQGRRTATVRAVTDCRVVSYLAADLLAQDLRELAAGHYREGR